MGRRPQAAPGVLVDVEAAFDSPVVRDVHATLSVPVGDVERWTVGQSGEFSAPIGDTDGTPTPHRLHGNWIGTPAGPVFTGIGVATNDPGVPVTAGDFADVAAGAAQALDVVRAGIAATCARVFARWDFALPGDPPVRLIVDGNEATLRAGTYEWTGVGSVAVTGDIPALGAELAQRRRGAGATPLTDDDYRRVAVVYEHAASLGEPVVPAVARQVGVGATPEPAAKRWIAEARRRGYLAPRRPGRPRKEDRGQP